MVTHQFLSFPSVCQVAQCLHDIQAAYEVQLENGLMVKAVLYLVYAEPFSIGCESDPLSEAAMRQVYQWHFVTRSEKC